ncbi:MAG TPA: ISL3 family transposase [Syntrophales bacterium]|nr:ISL3 family transposase [Syntrophales bacterium]
MHQVRDLDAGETHIYLEFEYRRVNCPRCGTVKRETLSWLASSARFTQRFEDRIGLLCREMSVKRVAELNDLSWDQVCRMEKSYMRRLMEQHPPSEDLRVIGIDEISVRKGHTYAIVVADLDQRRPIWLGGQGRTEEDMDLFYEMIGEKRCQSIQLAVMDMWKPFRKSTQHHAPNVRIVFDKFHIMKHLSAALDEVRRSEYKRASEKDKRFIKGQRYTLLSHKSNLNIKGQEALEMLLKANKRLNKAYLLKESFGQLWDYSHPTWARKFFDNWKAQLRWQRLPSFEKFAELIENHWEGIISYCHPDHKVSLGFMEGLNNKIRLIQRRAYGIRDKEYLMLKVVTSFIQDKKVP